MRLTVAFCTYNRAQRLPALVASLRRQTSPVPFEILAVNNNSSDATAEVLDSLQRNPDLGLRVVTERVQGIVAARNRALEEALASEYLLFIDDDELPCDGLVEAALDALMREGADCAGGAITVDFTGLQRPRWLGKELLGFLAEVDHGADPFWIADDSTPVWTSNIAYRMAMFREDPTLRFDSRYSRIGNAVGGGEDAVMLAKLLERNARIRYRPDMRVLHGVEAWRLARSYFLKLHYDSGYRQARWSEDRYLRELLGVPPFIVRQLLDRSLIALAACCRRDPAYLRLAMNVTHTLGAIRGYHARWREAPRV